MTVIVNGIQVDHSWPTSKESSINPW